MLLFTIVTLIVLAPASSAVRPSSNLEAKIETSEHAAPAINRQKMLIKISGMYTSLPNFKGPPPKEMKIVPGRKVDPDAFMEDIKTQVQAIGIYIIIVSNIMVDRAKAARTEMAMPTSNKELLAYVTANLHHNRAQAFENLGLYIEAALEKLAIYKTLFDAGLDSQYANGADEFILDELRKLSHVELIGLCQVKEINSQLLKETYDHYDALLSFTSDMDIHERDFRAKLFKLEITAFEWVTYTVTQSKA